MSRALVRRFRERWLAGAQPMVVVHRPGQPETICAAPSLWMGGKLVAERLREAGIGPGHRVLYDGPAGAAFVQVLVGVLRASATFCPENLAPLGLPAHAVVTEGLGVALREHAAPRGDSATRVLFRTRDAEAGSPVTSLDDATLEALAIAGALTLEQHAFALCEAMREADEPLRVGCGGDWRDSPSFAIEVLGGLLDEAELHLGTADVPKAQLEAIRSTRHGQIGPRPELNGAKGAAM